MDIRVKEILLDKVTSDWERFARCCLVDISKANAVIDHINGDEIKEDNNFKMICLLDILNKMYPENYKTKIISSLRDMDRNDVLKDLSNLDLSEKYGALKSFYLKNYQKNAECRPPLKIVSSVDILHEFVELCLIDAVDVQMDAAHRVELMEFLKKQKNYKTIQYNEVFMEEKSLLLISGIAGIGKSWLLRKCLLDWANNLIWKKVDFVFYFECKMLNRYQNVSSIKELLCAFYKDFVKDLDINNHNTLFVIDGLDEFKYLDDLINYSSRSQYPIVSTLAEIQNYKSVVAGRVYAIDHYQSIYGMQNVNNEKLTIQIMGFNNNGIYNYIENNVIEHKRDFVKTIFRDNSIANAWHLRLNLFHFESV